MKSRDFNVKSFEAGGIRNRSMNTRSGPELLDGSLTKNVELSVGFQGFSESKKVSVLRKGIYIQTGCRVCVSCNMPSKCIFCTCCSRSETRNGS